MRCAAAPFLEKLTVYWTTQERACVMGSEEASGSDVEVSGMVPSAPLSVGPRPIPAST